MQQSDLQRFLGRLTRSIPYSVCITNTNGIVIAATHSDRNGEFCASALSLLQEELPMLTVPTAEDADVVSTLLPLHEDGMLCGAMEVVGAASDTLNVAKTIQVALDAFMGEQRSNLPGRSRYHSDLSKALLFDESRNQQLLRRVTQKYNLIDDQARLPILIQAGLHSNCEKMLAALLSDYKTCSVYNSQDILLEMEGERILLFKYLPDISINCKFWADEVVCCLDAFFAQFGSEMELQNIFYFYGPIQLRFGSYANVYRCICWMERHLKSSPEHVDRFSSYLPEFLLKSIPEDILASIFDASIYRIQKLWDIDVFAETIAALIQSNMKLDTAAKQLFIHKNTVVFRLNKIREVLGLNPISNIRDANYLIMLYYYWRTYCA